MFYFPLISTHNGDKCLSREKKEIVFYPDKAVCGRPMIDVINMVSRDRRRHLNELSRSFLRRSSFD